MERRKIFFAYNLLRSREFFRFGYRWTIILCVNRSPVTGRSSYFLSLSPSWSRQKVTGAAALSILCNSITGLTRLVRLTRLPINFIALPLRQTEFLSERRNVVLAFEDRNIGNIFDIVAMLIFLWFWKIFFLPETWNVNFGLANNAFYLKLIIQIKIYL